MTAKKAVRARDRHCRFPGCTTPAAHTDTDHLIPWPTGQTTPTNLAPECRGHHLIKTHSAGPAKPTRRITDLDQPLGTQHTTYPWNYNNPEA
ncbi:MAG: HNH endonuclease [Micrococcales bacterium]|nr:HNH endonuclease [Micrococcales bacterium]